MVMLSEHEKSQLEIITRATQRGLFSEEKSKNERLRLACDAYNERLHQLKKTGNEISLQDSRALQNKLYALYGVKAEHHLFTFRDALLSVKMPHTPKIHLQNLDELKSLTELSGNPVIRENRAVTINHWGEEIHLDLNISWRDKSEDRFRFIGTFTYDDLRYKISIYIKSDFSDGYFFVDALIPKAPDRNRLFNIINYDIFNDYTCDVYSNAIKDSESNMNCIINCQDDYGDIASMRLEINWIDIYPKAAKFSGHTHFENYHHRFEAIAQSDDIVERNRRSNFVYGDLKLFGVVL